jgi:dTDP-4-amino-4,6-dideoxygalactose transaminase
MINLFNINNYVVDTSKFNHHLHATVVRQFEEEFAEYVGARYACSVNSATNAIFLAFLNKSEVVGVPSMIPPVVLNALINSGNTISFSDNVQWVGHSYLLHDFGEYRVIDSAQQVDRDQFKNMANPDDLMIFSFYPTKPVGGLDGGMIVTDDLDKISWFREAVLNGMSYSKDNWKRDIKFPGWKMYLSSVQAHVALQNFYKLEEKKEALAEIRQKYNVAFGYNNTSEHLYRISATNREEGIKNMKKDGILCGIHYTATHLHPIYRQRTMKQMPKTEKEEATTISIPYHEKLTNTDVEMVIKSVRKYFCCLEDKVV